MFSLLKLLCFIAILINVNGCYIPHRPNEAYNLQTLSEDKLAQLNNWRAEGKIAFMHANKGLNINFEFSKNNEYYTLVLYGPFGIGKTLVSSSPLKLTLQKANGTVVTGANLTELIAQTHAEGHESAIDVEGLSMKVLAECLVGLTPSHYKLWQISYKTNYVDSLQLVLPKWIVMTKADNSKIKVLIKNWTKI